MGARLYRRTKAGTAAWQGQDARVPLEYRRLLGLIVDDIHPDSLRTRFARYSEAEIVELLDELVEQGLLEAVEAKTQRDLDFTDSFKLGELQDADHDLDFTDSFRLAELRKPAASS